MSAGYIVANHAHYEGGGVTLSPGSLASITGGNITENTSDVYGAGIFNNNASLKLEGNTKICLNTIKETANNIFLCKNSFVTITNKLTDDLSIGVSYAPTEETTRTLVVTEDYTLTDGDIKAIVLDNTNIRLLLTDSGLSAPIEATTDSGVTNSDSPAVLVVLLVIATVIILGLTTALIIVIQKNKPRIPQI